MRVEAVGLTSMSGDSGCVLEVSKTMSVRSALHCPGSHTNSPAARPDSQRHNNVLIRLSSLLVRFHHLAQIETTDDRGMQ